MKDTATPRSDSGDGDAGLGEDDCSFPAHHTKGLYHRPLV